MAWATWANPNSMALQATETFPYSDGELESVAGGAWTTPYASEIILTLASSVLQTTYVGGRKTPYIAAVVPDSDDQACESRGPSSTGGLNLGAGVVIRASATGGYFLTHEKYPRVLRASGDWATWTQLAGGAALYPPQIILQAVGNNIKAWAKKYNASTFTAVCDVTDAAYASGAVGLCGTRAIDSTPFCDTWYLHSVETAAGPSIPILVHYYANQL
ncbi:MAG: hypothetical protein KKD77_21570 [Gammaproteobacteria bacterium]|nr:hypothetical protein [Gammaproteobacteria bacterium]